MQPTTLQKPSQSAASYKEPLIIGGVLLLLASAAGVYYYLQKTKSKQTQKPSQLPPLDISMATPPYTAQPRSGSTVPIVVHNKRGYPLKRGSRHSDVKVLQRYLKIYKANLGRSGAKRDGVDGIFGLKTQRAAQKHLKKTVFTHSDITEMRKALVSLGK